MTEPLRQPTSPRLVMPRIDKRRHQRVKVNLLGRFMLEDRREYPCQVVNMSPGGAALISPVKGALAERVVAYIDHIGRVEGHVVRHIEGGFVITIEATLRKRDKIAAQLTWLANRHVLHLPEDRRHERYQPRNPFTTLTFDDGHTIRCRLIDVSLSGAAVALAVERPELGTQVTLGKIRARVVRQFEDGVAVEFSTIQTRETLELNFG